MRVMNQRLIDMAAIPGTRSKKKACASCRRQNERQAMVSVPGKNLDILEVPRLFYYFNVLFWYIYCSRPLVIPRGHFKIHDFIRGVGLAQIATITLRKKNNKARSDKYLFRALGIAVDNSDKRSELCQDCASLRDSWPL